MSKIFLLIGKSTCGKDTIYRNLLSDPDLSLSKIVMYTTRPMREGETNGVQYFFCRDEEYENLKKEGKIIEERTYQTQFGPWHYFTVDDGQIESGDTNYLMIGTIEAFVSLQSYYGKEKVIPIYIAITDKLRMERAMKREEKQAVPRYDELCRRFLADDADYSLEKRQDAGITREFDNSGELTDCLGRIKTFIQDQIR